MRFKQGVTLFGVRPEMLIALSVADNVYGDIVGHGVTVTSVTDGAHGSIVHSIGCGVDIRTRSDSGSKQWNNSLKQKLAQEIRDRLTDEFDVIVESDHIHIELDKR